MPDVTQILKAIEAGDPQAALYWRMISWLAS
jgi:hypothetical protein